MSAAGLDFLIILACQFSLVLHIILQSSQCSQHKERTGSQSEDVDRYIGIRHDPESEDRSCRQNLSHGTDTGQSQGETKSHAKSVKQRRNRRIGVCIALRSSQNNTVHNDQRNVYTQCIIQRRQICL